MLDQVALGTPPTVACSYYVVFGGGIAQICNILSPWHHPINRSYVQVRHMPSVLLTIRLGHAVLPQSPLCQADCVLWRLAAGRRGRQKKDTPPRLGGITRSHKAWQRTDASPVPHRHTSSPMPIASSHRGHECADTQICQLGYLSQFDVLMAHLVARPDSRVRQE
jgi:hypothetical protein